MVVPVLAFVCSFLGAVLVAQWFARKDTEIEKRRTAAFHLAQTLSKVGLVKIPEFLGMYAVGDYSGMLDKMIRLRDLFVDGGEEMVVKEFREVFSRCLDAALSSPEGRAEVEAKLKAAAAVG